jgi:osmoprotectant transport system ATP-binding protein
VGIEFRSVTKEFPDGTRAVEDFSLVIPSRKTTVFVGSSGCGKTTLLRMINRMVEPTGGDIEIDGHSILRRDAVTLRRSIGYVMQNSGLMPHFTVIDNVATVPVLGGVPKKKAREQALSLLDTVGLDRSLAKRYPSQLSGGQQQRVAIARSLINEPSIILADEPTGNLDTRTSIEVMGIFQRLNIERGITIILITHEMDIAEYGTRLVRFRDGKIQIDQKIKERRDAAKELAALPPPEEIDPHTVPSDPVPADHLGGVA